MKHLSISHDYNDPVDFMSESANDLREEIVKYCNRFEGKRVFLIGDGGSYFDDKAYPVNRMFIHEDTSEILRFFDAYNTTTKPELKNGEYTSYWFLQMYDTYKNAFDVASDIVTETTTSNLRHKGDK
jgi:hypothetical protein